MNTMTEAFSKVAIDATNIKAAALINARIHVLTNIQEHLDTLQNLAPRNAYFACSAVATSLGYTIVNQLLWANRKANAKTAAKPSIDWLNDGSAEQHIAETNAAHVEEIGLQSLPQLNALLLTGVYKGMMRRQMANVAYCVDFPPRQPNEILAEMLSNDNTAETAAAYKELTDKEITTSRAVLAIRAEMAKQSKMQTIRDEAKHKGETEYVLGELMNSRQGELTDELWEGIPLFVQYKLTISVWKQTVKALVFSINTTAEPDDIQARLFDLVNTMQLELELAARDPEIKLAFALEKLDERHELPKEVKDATAVKDGITVHAANNEKSRFRRAPTPAKEVDTGIEGLVSTQAPTINAVDVQNARTH